MAARTANGWAVLARTSPLLHTWQVPGTGRDPVELRIRRGSVGFVLVHNAMYFDEDVERLDLGSIRDDWGYAERPIGGSSVITNHAMGGATDVNATRHPRGVPVRKTFTDKQIQAIRKHLKLYDGILDWGGNWPSHPGSTALTDGMHFEIAPGVSMGDVEKVARRLVNSNARRVKAILAANPGQRKVIFA